MDTQPITAAVAIRCPHCRQTIERVFAERIEASHPRERKRCYIEVIDHAEEDRGWQAEMFVSRCASCDGFLVDLDLIHIEDVGGDLRQHPAFMSLDDVPCRHLVASAGARDWIMARYTTPAGPLDVHRFSAMRDDVEAWDGPDVAPIDSDSSPWNYAQHFMLCRWVGCKTPPPVFKRVRIGEGEPLEAPAS